MFYILITLYRMNVYLVAVEVDTLGGEGLVL